MAVNKRGLGKGLDTMIPPVKNEKKSEKGDLAKGPETLVNITKGEPNREQPRKDFDEDGLLELADSIKQFGILQSGCMTSEILGNANNITFKKVRHSGNRQGCKCIENRNIGDYDTCPNGCKYCYANKNPHIAQENYKKHNPNDLMILGNLKPTDEIQQSNQKSYLENFIKTKLF